MAMVQVDLSEHIILREAKNKAEKGLFKNIVEKGKK